MVVDKSNFEAVIARELPVLYRVALRLCLNPTVAEDVVGLTLVRAVGAWDRFDGQYERSWLLTILRREYLAHIRRASSSELSLDSFTQDGVEIPSGDTNATDKIDLERALAALDDIDRTLIILSDIEEMGAKEISEITGIYPATVRTRIFRARQRLRRILLSFGENL